MAISCSPSLGRILPVHWRVLGLQISLVWQHLSPQLTRHKLHSAFPCKQIAKLIVIATIVEARSRAIPLTSPILANFSTLATLVSAHPLSWTTLAADASVAWMAALVSAGNLCKAFSIPANWPFSWATKFTARSQIRFSAFTAKSARVAITCLPTVVVSGAKLHSPVSGLWTRRVTLL